MHACACIHVRVRVFIFGVYVLKQHHCITAGGAIPVVGLLERHTQLHDAALRGYERESQGARERGNEGAREQGSEGARERGSEGAKESARARSISRIKRGSTTRGAHATRKLHICTYRREYENKYVRTYVNICIHTSIRTYRHTYLHMHTHTHTSHYRDLDVVRTLILEKRHSSSQRGVAGWFSPRPPAPFRHTHFALALSLVLSLALLQNYLLVALFRDFPPPIAVLLKAASLEQ